MNEQLHKIGQLASDILYYNKMYRIGQPKISDPEYDALVAELENIDPNHQALIDKDYTPIGGSEQVPLPVEIASLTKLARDKKESAFEKFQKWVAKHNLYSEDAVLSGKYDGVMMLIDERSIGDKKAYKKGEGNVGHVVDHHYRKISTNGSPYKCFSVGEVIYSRKTFETKFASEYENARNMIAGKTNPLSDADDTLYYADYIRYSLISEEYGEYAYDKVDQLTFLNGKLNKVPVKFVVVKFKDITEQFLDDKFKEWSEDYEIDGIVIDINRKELRQKLGRETGTNNPAYARAYKGDFEDRAETDCTKLTWEITKLGVLAPRCWFHPVRLNGATVQKCYVDNAKFVLDSGLHVGAHIIVKRSGMIIPRLSEVIFDKYTVYDPYDGVDVKNTEKRFEIAQEHGILPHNCPICSGELELTENDKGEKVNLMCINPDCSGKALRRIIFFFKIMGAKGVGESTFEMLYDKGYDTVEKILELTVEDFLGMDGYAKSKAEGTWKALHDCLEYTDFVKIMHASGCFPKMGADKLGIIYDYVNALVGDGSYFDVVVLPDELVKLAGIADKSAATYLNSVDPYYRFYKTIERFTTFKSESQEETVNTNGKCAGWVCVFTRWRDKEIKKIIEQEGGIVKEGYSKAITHVFPAEKGFLTNKEQKAIDDGKTIMDQHELKAYLGVGGYNKKEDKKEEDSEFSMNW